jgi:hypothetical protein
MNIDCVKVLRAFQIGCFDRTAFDTNAATTKQSGVISVICGRTNASEI